MNDVAPRVRFSKLAAVAGPDGRLRTGKREIRIDEALG